MTRRAALTLLSLIVVSGAMACGPGSTEIVVESAPPPEQIEVVGLAPYQGAVWVRGHWQWNGGRYVWFPGHWERPRVGYIWIHAHWERRGNRWGFIPGHWRRV